MQNEAIYEEKYKNCLIKVYQDEDNGTSPREWSNLGYFITQDNRYNSPDTNEELQAVIKAGGEYASSQAEHIKYIKSHYSEKILDIYPVTKYEHGGVSYSLGTVHGFDNSNNGFYIITEKTQKEVGTNKKDFEKQVRQELKTYTEWANGEVYGFDTIDEFGNSIESVWGFVGDYNESGLMQQAREAVDYYMVNNYPKAKTEHERAELYTRHEVNLLDLSKSEDETIKRNAISLIKQLKIK